MEPTINQPQNSATKVIISAIVFLAVVIGIIALAVGAKKDTPPETTADTTADTDTTPTTSETPSPSTSTTTPTPNTPTTSGNTYKDGTYTARGAYRSPAGSESINLSLTIKNDVVTAVIVTPQATNPNSIKYQGQFTAGIAAQVVGKDLDTLSVGKVSGSSLTAGGFNDALVKIKAEARS